MPLALFRKVSGQIEKFYNVHSMEMEKFVESSSCLVKHSQCLAVTLINPQVTLSGIVRL